MRNSGQTTFAAAPREATTIENVVGPLFALVPAKAPSYEALPFGGALIVYDPVIDDERRRNAFGLLMSLNMLIETLVGPDSMVIGIK
jgi:hypothetical protein